MKRRCRHKLFKQTAEIFKTAEVSKTSAVSSCSKVWDRPGASGRETGCGSGFERLFEFLATGVDGSTAQVGSPSAGFNEVERESGVEVLFIGYSFNSPTNPN